MQTAPQDQKVELLGLNRDELREFMVSLGEKPYRSQQLYEAIYRRRVTGFDAMTELPKTLRRILDENAVVGRIRIDNVFISSDGTRRFLLKLGDGSEIESVFMPEEGRDTICISSQAGCPLACSFCMTGVMGLKRNLTAGEIVAQVLIVLNEVYGPLVETPHRTNIVMMGMGEPLLNFDNVMKSIRLFADQVGLNIAPRRVTLSTAGIVPRIHDLAREDIRPRLAISLTAPTDELRNRLFPINSKYPLAELIGACRAYPLGARERLTFEYVMLAGVNDSDQNARELVRLLSDLRAKVNLIPHNPAPELPFQSSSMDRILAFQKILTDARLHSFIRRPRGQDISAACGQLAARHQAIA
ncbi:MAG TPA: 23S rRNA (adenine(2503)-C(2))-methyltransferase RlmN [Blastocatellia bacterium]|jgi:23S rRNA (adenine2503-C2)-methyltransferase|nr:23S rRNA (adenine(2503)-C(2))-methyltransferase RlmN [Blastocatellia bacterium]